MIYISYVTMFGVSIMDKDKLYDTMQDIEDSADYTQSLVDELVSKCCGSFDEYLKYVSDLINGGVANITDEQLDDIILTIPTHLYFVGTQQERLGIKQDMSESLRNAMYNKIFLELTGTVSAKDAQAKAQLFNEDMTTAIYKRAYSTIKAKTQTAMELLQSAKKVASRRMAELDLSKNIPQG